MKSENVSKWVRKMVAPAAVAVALAGLCIRAFAMPTESVYLYVGGTPTLETADWYDGGDVYDAPSHQIGTVPNPTTDGHILDSGGHSIGFISPSPAASQEIP